MASAKKRKIGDEGRMLNKEWENSYFFVEISEKPVCLTYIVMQEASDALSKTADSCTF